MSNQNVDAAASARDVLVRLKIQSIPTPVEKIAKLLGVQVRFSPLDEELSGMIYIKDGVPIMGVNSLHHPNRQRFTIAHELGHFELHREMITSHVHVDKSFPVLMRNVTSSTGTDQVEVQANQFAAELLMPSEQLDQILSGKQFDIDDDGPIEEIAKKFKVSVPALRYRIRNQF